MAGTAVNPGRPPRGPGLAVVVGVDQDQQSTDELGVLCEGLVEALFADDLGAQGAWVAAEEYQNPPARGAVDGRLAEMGDWIFGNPSAVFPGCAHIARYAQHAEAGKGSVGFIGSFARHQQATVGQSQQTAAADARVLGRISPDGVGQGREAHGVAPGVAVVVGTNPEGLARTGDPVFAVVGIFGRDQLVAGGVEKDAAVGKSMDTAVHDAAHGIGSHQMRTAPGLAFVGGAAGLYVEEWVFVVGFCRVGCALEGDQQVAGWRAGQGGAQRVHPGFAVDGHAMYYAPVHIDHRPFSRG